jgi:flagellin-like protein
LKKGITPVVAIILLLLITIAVIGFAFGFFQSMLEAAGGAASTQLNSTTNQLAKSIDVVAVSGTSVTIRNTGSANIVPGEIGVVVANAVRACTFTATEIAPGTVATCTLASACTAGQTVVVSAPANSDEAQCA